MEVILQTKTAAGSHRHILAIAYALFLCPPHPLSLHRFPPQKLYTRVWISPLPSPRVPLLHEDLLHLLWTIPSQGGQHPSPPPSLWERGRRPPLTCSRHVSLLQGSEAFCQQHFCCQPPTCLRAEGTGRAEKLLPFFQRCLCCWRWRRQQWLCKQGLLAPALRGHGLWHSLFPRKGRQGMPKSSFWERKD